MPTLTNIVDRVCAWTDENICQKVMLKVPPDDMEKADGAGYEYTEAHPACFPLFVPSSDKLPPKVNAPIPSLCVRIIDGEDGRSTGSVNLEMCFATWNPGTHGQDILKLVDGKRLIHAEWKGSEAEAYFKRNAEGWRDIWNWIDTALRELESTASIDGLPIDRDKGIKFGPMKEDDGIPDYYPFWFASIGFTINRPIVRNVKEYDEFL